MTVPRFEIRFKLGSRVVVRFRSTRKDAEDHVAYLARHGYKAKLKELQQ